MLLCPPDQSVQNVPSSFCPYLSPPALATPCTICLVSQTIASFALEFSSKPPFLNSLSCPGEHLNDLYKFIPSNETWSTLHPSGLIPIGRTLGGFTSTPDGMLYLYGGYNALSGPGQCCSESTSSPLCGVCAAHLDRCLNIVIR